MSAPLTLCFLLDSVPISRAVVAGQTSLGGSESAMIGLARALAARGHKVAVYATKLDRDAIGPDHAGVTWASMDVFYRENQFLTWDVVCSLRMFHWMGNTINARLRLLWNQDLLVGHAGEAVMSVAWNLDHIVYVSDYHRRQWEDRQPELAPLSWVTKNGYDPACVPTDAVKDPNRIIHISRPERGLGPILQMWPALKAQRPDATLQICRYASMYDGEGSNVREACLSYDQQVAQVNAKVGGIEYLGSLNKEQLYKAIADAAVMWYPGVSTFAETSCVAAIEAQANGTPFVGSLKGALPETIPSGILLPGAAEDDPVYQDASIAAVVDLLDGCQAQSREYRELRKAGLQHVTGYTYDAIAAEWEAQCDNWFAARYEGNTLGVLRQLLHDDDHCAAKRVARDFIESSDACCFTPAHVAEAHDAGLFCDRVIAGKEQGPEAYAAHAIQDPLQEVELCTRFREVAPAFKDCTRVLDVACGNGAGAISIALANPSLHIVGLDYAAANIAHATDAAQRAGVGDRCTFLVGTAYDFDTQTMCDLWPLLPEGTYDGLFVGEFIEHVADCTALVDSLEQYLTEGATVAYTCPCGPFVELVQPGQYLQKGHVHNFESDDINAVFGGKAAFAADYLEIGLTPRGNAVGHWLVRYVADPERPAGVRDYATRIVRTRPMERITVGMIACNAADDLSRCLRSVWAIADEILVGDTGSADGTRDIVTAYGGTVIQIEPVSAQEQGFAGARNAVLKAAKGEWFLWIDADEILTGAHDLRRYTEGAIFNGAVIQQHHLQLDAPQMHDVPIRLFRTGKGIQFYGCVHEQPQMGDCNGDIVPALELSDTKIAHTGYLTESVRRDKMLHRNLPLLARDQEIFPDRVLGKVLVLRDYVNLSDRECEMTGRMTAKAQRGYAHAVRLFMTHFDDPTHKYHAIARPWYEASLQKLGLGWECEFSFAGEWNGLGKKRAKPQRVWVRDYAEWTRLVQARMVDGAAAQMLPAPIKTDPFVTAPSPVAA